MGLYGGLNGRKTFFILCYFVGELDKKETKDEILRLA